MNEVKDLKTKYPQAFPTLNDRQIKIVEEFSKCKTYEDGEYLFHAGETEFMFHVLKSGGIEILDRSGGNEKILVTHDQPGEFTGDVANLTGGPANADARAKGKTDVYEICSVALMNIIAERPALSDLVLQTFITRVQVLQEIELTGLRVIGSQYSQDTFRIRDFLSKNQVLFTWIDIETDSQVGELLKTFQIKPEETPIVSYAEDWVLKNPSNEEIAEKLNIKRNFNEQEVYDLAIVGGGPAGLAAAVYGASEGLKTIVLEKTAPGGQAATSSKIENYLGFPTGLSGKELASRATLQAQKFGSQMSVSSAVKKLTLENKLPILQLENGENISTKTLLISSGAEYRKLNVEGRERFDGAGVYYAATQMEAQICGGENVIVVGGGNSAGQAAIFLAEKAHKVYLLIRGDDLNAGMSRYLSKRIEDTRNIELMQNTEITKIYGEDHVEKVDIINNKTQEKSELEIIGIFSFIGAKPRTEWLPSEIETDENGFVKTGIAIANSNTWRLKRPPYFLETSHQGVFAAGDVRANSVKRVASAVGEGSMTVQFVHEYLRDF